MSLLTNVVAIVAAGISPAAIPLATLDSLGVELDVRPSGILFVRMFTDECDKGTTRRPGKCQRPAPKAKATFNGEPLVRLTGVYAAGDLQYDRDCLLELAFPGPTPNGMAMAGPIPPKARSAGSASIRIDEGATHLALEVPDAFTPRRLMLVSPADGILRAGQRVTMRWQPASDDISKADIGIRRPGGPAEETLAIRNKDLAIKGDRIDFTIPTAVPDGLRGGVEIRLLGTAYVKPRVGPCPVARCDVDVIFDVAPVPARLR